ncbi:AAA family ATPase [Arthrobacter sp. HY1533]|uniref:AAA family ATPase n=1 Tax=Arthrobacter sp. HY1533 TaxID=2970919 RepID=UPI0022B9FFC1|nr:AAA family ATPase [Arthrobacter sp. HY1533]
MKFVVREINARTNWPQAYPEIHLIKNNWDDYAFKTTFTAIVKLSQTEEIELGAVKILDYNYPVDSARTILPETFRQLPSNYCSLGDGLDFYEKLSEIPESIRSEFLQRMNDAAFSDEIKKRFKDRPGFETSLLRSPSATAALSYAKYLMNDIDFVQGSLALTYTAIDGANLNLEYKTDSVLDGRINAVIGYNGVGKTRLLADIAHVSTSDGFSSDSSLAWKFGRFSDTDHRFPRTVAVSYSAFDSFDVPPARAPIAWKSKEETRFGYYYSGLRKFNPTSDNDSSAVLKSVDERFEELKELVKSIGGTEKLTQLTRAANILFAEPSFRRLGIALEFYSESWGEEFLRLSSGHQISISILIHLSASLQVGSLVLLDEPETHLHPTLIAALMKALQALLSDAKSYALIATHSPIVLQEIPAQQIHIVRWAGGNREFVRPSRETFGEDLGVLTEDVFNLNADDSTFVGKLEQISKSLSPKEIRDLFPLGVSSQALAILMQNGVDFGA